MNCKAALGRLVVLLATFVLLAQTALAAGIKVVPSSTRVTPGEDFTIDIVAEDIPADDGLGAVQFRLNVAVPGGKAAGVTDLNQAAGDAVSVASPLLISEPTASRSGLGPFFLSAHQGSSGILVLDNEPLQNGSALYTYAHTNGASLPAGTGSVARFIIRVGQNVAAEQIDISLSDVLLLDGGPAYPLDTSQGATITLRCTTEVPALSGLSLAEAQSALSEAGLSPGSVYEIDNLGGAKSLDVVLAQSLAPGTLADCESLVELAINTAPAEVSNLAAADKIGDDTGIVVLSWNPSTPTDAAGYRIYHGATLVSELTDPQAGSAEIDGLSNGTAREFKVAAFDTFGNENAGVTVSATALDDVAPEVAITGIQEGAYYNAPVTPQVEVVETNPAGRTLTLNGAAYDLSAIVEDGAYTLAVAATDASGNETSRSVTFTVDTVAPEITVADLNDGGYYNADLSPPITVSDLNLKTAATGYLLNGQPYVPGTPVTEEGAYTLQVTAQDLAGNDASLTLDFVIDKSAPTVAAQVGTPQFTGGDTLYVTGLAAVTLAAEDQGIVPSGVAAVEYRLDQGAWLAYGDALSLSSLADAEHTVAYRASDVAGNVAAEQTLALVVDNTAPQTSAAVAAPQHAAANTLYMTGASVVTLSAADNLSGVAATEYRLDGGEWTAYEPFIVSAEGEHLIEYRSRDNLGNLEAAQFLTVVVDNTAPTTAITTGTPRHTGTDGTLYVTSATAFTLAAEDALAGVGTTEYRIDGGAWTPYVPFTISGEGSHVIGFRSTDNVGNVENEKTLAVVVDDTPPATTITTGSPQHTGTDGALYVTSATAFTLTAADSLSGVAATEYRIDGGAWTAYAPFAISTEGEHLVEYRSRDNLGILEAAKVQTVTVDNSAPTTAITTGGSQHTGADGTLYVTSATEFILTAVDSLSGVAATSYCIDDGPWTAYVPFTLSGEGRHLIAFRSTDHLGNLEGEKTLTVTVDDTPPVTGIDVGTPQHADSGGTLYATSATTFTLSATDSLSGVAGSEYRIDGGEWTAYAPFAVAGLADGAHAVGYRSTDSLGNVETEQVLTVIVDNTAPQTSIMIEEPKHASTAGTLYVTGATSFALSATDNLSGVSGTEYRLDGGPWATYAPFVIPAEGEHLIEYRSTDHLGNLEAVKTLTVIVDNTPPVSSASAGSPQHQGGDILYLTGSCPITLGALDALSGVAGTEYRIDGGQWLAYAAPFTLARLSDGVHTVGCRSTDNLGNVEAEEVLTVTVDNTAPKSAATVEEPQHTGVDGTLYVTDSTPFLLSAADNLAGVARTEYRVDSGQWTAYAPFTVPAEGEHLIEYRSADHLGNLEAAKNLAVTVDNTPPETRISTGEPQHVSADGTLFVTGATAFTLDALDNLSAVAKTEYRIDGGAWTAYVPFTLGGLADGEHSIGFRSVDNVDNVETEQLLTVVVDNTAPVTSINVGEPQFAGAALYVTGATEFTLSAADNLSGVVKTEYRIDGGAWTAYAPFTLADLSEGEHLIEFYSADSVLNVEEVQALTVVVDNAPPETSIGFNHQSYLDGETILISRDTELILSAADNLAGVAAAFYRFDEETVWRSYHGAFRLADLDYGSHTIRYRSVDNVENMETEKAVTVVLIGVEVDTTFLNLPRVLVWTEDPAEAKGNSRPAWTAQEVRTLLEDALDVPDVYCTVVTAKEDFRRQLRSGIYNMTMVINQDVPFDAVFLRELREAVHRGMGLLVSSWGNSVPPILQDLFGVNFKGSLAMDESERALHLFQSPVTTEQSLTTSGRVLKADLDGGTLAGLVLGESACDGIRGLALRYPIEVNVGDRVTASLHTPRGKKLSLVEEETATVAELPAPEVNRFTGNGAGDLAIEAISAEGITVSLDGPYGYLEEAYSLSLTVERTDGSRVVLDPVPLTPTCEANLCAGTKIGPFEVERVDEDRIKSGEDLPAVVLNEYGMGRTAFLSYNILESALHDDRSAHAELLRKAAGYLLPQEANPEAGSVPLLETRVKLYGTGMDLMAVETLGEGLTHLPLFDLTQKPLEYAFRLEDGQEAAYRYFVRIADEQGGFSKETEVSLGLSDGYTRFDSYPYTFSVDSDADSLLQQALAWVDEQAPVHPEAAAALQAIRDELVQIGCLPRTTAAEMEKVIHTVVQTVHHAGQLGFDAHELRSLLGQYLRIMEGEGYFGE